MIQYKVVTQVPINQLLDLYKDAGWYKYTNNIETLHLGVQKSLFVFAAYEHEKLVGLVRVVGDGLTIIYIQDLLVLTSYQRQGIGTKLLSHVLNVFKDINQKVLLTDDVDRTRAFYESLSFTSCDSGDMVAYYHNPKK